jgi:hypothetical protein
MNNKRMNGSLQKRQKVNLSYVRPYRDGVVRVLLAAEEVINHLSGRFFVLFLFLCLFMIMVMVAASVTVTVC